MAATSGTAQGMIRPRLLLEDELKRQGAHYTKGKDWASYVKQDGLLITGQNPGSSADVAKQLLKTLEAI